MSSSCKPKPWRFGGDIRRPLLAAEAGQKADILTYSSGHLGPSSLIQSQPHKETKPVFWKTSQCKEETPNPLTHKKRQTKICVKKKEKKESTSGYTSATNLVEPAISGSRQDQVTDHSSHASKREDRILPKMVCSSSNSLPVQLKVCSQKRPKSSSGPEGNHQVRSSQSAEEGLNNEDQHGMTQQFGRQIMKDLWTGINVAEKHERKLQEEVNKLSAQSGPNRDRLAVFSDVFDDVCEDSPVFGCILREIKTDYDLYVSHLMASQSLLQNKSQEASLRDVADVKVKEIELDEAEKEVYRLEQEARRALEAKKRAQNELRNIPAILGPEDSDMKKLQDSPTGCTDSIQARRLQVLNMWKEIQQLEEEIKEKMVSTVITTATERRIKDQRAEIMKLIASNERLRTINKDLENNINVVLNREKANKAIRRMLWDEIHCDLQTETE